MLEVVSLGINEVIWYVRRLFTYITQSVVQGDSHLLALFVIGISISVIFLAINIIRSIISSR